LILENMLKQKALFLDIDGVLNSNRYYISLPKEDREKSYDEYGDKFDPLSKSLLNKLILRTGAKVVISSVWRGAGLDVMQRMWIDREMEGEVIGITPNFRNYRSGEYSVTIPRGLEIEWYYENVFKFRHWTYDSEYVRDEKEKCVLDTYVILDDDSDMLYSQRNNFVKCNNLFGFTQKEYEKAYLILMHGVL
jgi:hypothetical protein